MNVEGTVSVFVYEKTTHEVDNPFVMTAQRISQGMNSTEVEGFTYNEQLMEMGYVAEYGLSFEAASYEEAGEHVDALKCKVEKDLAARAMGDNVTSWFMGGTSLCGPDLRETQQTS